MLYLLCNCVILESVVEVPKMEKNTNKFYSKGKMVTESMYNRRLPQSETGKKSGIHEWPQHESSSENLQSKESHTSTEETAVDNGCTKPAEGRRIVDLLALGDQMWCSSCKECLSLQCVEGEQRRGLGSILSMRCQKCLLISSAETEGNTPRLEISKGIVDSM